MTPEQEALVSLRKEMSRNRWQMIAMAAGVGFVLEAIVGAAVIYQSPSITVEIHRALQQTDPPAIQT